MEDLVGHIIFDYFTYGNYAIQVIFNKLGIPVELYALDVARCRLNGNKDKVFYSKKTWTKYQQVADVFDRFGYAEIDPEKPTQIYFYNGSGVRSVYNKAPWAAALNDVLCEIEGSEYSLNVSGLIRGTPMFTVTCFTSSLETYRFNARGPAFVMISICDR